MKEIKAFIRVDVSQELPEKHGWYDTDNKKCFYHDLHKKFFTHDHELASPVKVLYWFKEISLTEYMVGFAEWISKNICLYY